MSKEHAYAYESGYQDGLRAAESDNAKLRDLVKDMWQYIPKSESCEFDVYAGHCTGNCKGECAFWYAMRELGVEVE